MSTSIKCIVGLGNPGQQYEKTRHNAGFWFIDALANEFNVTLSPEKKFNGHHERCQIAGQDCHLLMPNTFMNRSGESVQALANFFKIKSNEILVAHDELDFPAGSVRFKPSGGHGGHNGLRDIIKHLDKDFLRLRIGIGRRLQERQHDYVLSRPSANDKHAIDLAIDKVLPLVPFLVEGNIEKAILNLHTEEKPDKKPKTST